MQDLFETATDVLAERGLTLALRLSSGSHVSLDRLLMGIGPRAVLPSSPSPTPNARCSPTGASPAPTPPPGGDLNFNRAPPLRVLPTTGGHHARRLDSDPLTGRKGVRPSGNEELCSLSPGQFTKGEERRSPGSEPKRERTRRRALTSEPAESDVNADVKQEERPDRFKRSSL